MNGFAHYGYASFVPSSINTQLPTPPSADYSVHVQHSHPSQRHQYALPVPPPVPFKPIPIRPSHTSEEVLSYLQANAPTWPREKLVQSIHDLSQTLIKERNAHAQTREKLAKTHGEALSWSKAAHRLKENYLYLKRILDRREEVRVEKVEEDLIEMREEPKVALTCDSEQRSRSIRRSKRPPPLVLAPLAVSKKLIAVQDTPVDWPRKRQRQD